VVEISNKLIIIISVVVFLALIFFILSIKLEKKFIDSPVQAEPKYLEAINKNPDFIYTGKGILKDLNVTDWESDGYYYSGTVCFSKKIDIFSIYSIDTEDCRKGILIIYPEIMSETGNAIFVNRYVNQSLNITDQKSHILKISVANIAGASPDMPVTKCDDVGFHVKIIDKTTGKVDIIDDFIVNSKDGWKDLQYDLDSKYNGKNIVIMIESYSGGPCGSDDQEWATIDYVALV
jgi:hypothetical protein